ncbi:MAG: tripartite tricarboxylate transporter substrate-binding protein [Burkholderiales bacterium]
MPHETDSGTPATVVNKVNAETVKALRAPEIRELLLLEGIEPIGSTAPELRTYFHNDVQRTAKLIKTSNIKVE